MSTWPEPGEAEPLRQAALDLIGERRSYEAIATPELLARGEVGRPWFEAHFSGRDDCLAWAAATELRAFTARMWEVYEAEPGWREGMRAVAYALADWIESDPRFAVAATLTMSEGGERATLEREAAIHTMIDMVDLGRQEMADPGAIGRAPAEATFGAIFHAVRAAAAGRDAPAAAEVVPQFMYMAVRPYLGDEAAREELSMPRPPRPAAGVGRDTGLYEGGTGVQREAGGD